MLYPVIGSQASLIGTFASKLEKRAFRRSWSHFLAFRDGQLNFPGDLKLIAQTKTSAAWLRPLFFLAEDRWKVMVLFRIGSQHFLSV